MDEQAQECSDRVLIALNDHFAVSVTRSEAYHILRQISRDLEPEIDPDEWRGCCC